MHPILFEIPLGSGLPIHAYGVLAAIGFVAALLWIRFQSRREGLPVPRMFDLAFLMMVAALVGSRLVYVLIDWRFYLRNPVDLFKIWQGGLVFYGGLIACIITAWWYLRRHGLNFWRVSDVFMPGVALGHGFGRIGCFLAGCCFGRTCPTDAWYAVVFPRIPGTMAPVGQPLIPTQLMEAGANFLLFAWLAWKSRKKGFDGQILLLYLIGYSTLRIVIEYFRGDLERGFAIRGILSTSQLIGVLLILAAVAVLCYRRKSHREGT